MDLKKKGSVDLWSRRGEICLFVCFVEMNRYRSKKGESLCGLFCLLAVSFLERRLGFVTCVERNRRSKKWPKRTQATTNQQKRVY